MRTVYKTKYYTVKKDDSGPTPKYLIYRDGVEVKKCSSQVEATMWVSRQRGRQNEHDPWITSVDSVSVEEGEDENGTPCFIVDIEFTDIFRNSILVEGVEV